MLYWPEYFLAKLGGDLPETYLCFDTETTGFSLQKDVIVEWGHALVVDRKIVSRYDVILNWYDSDLGVPNEYITEALLRLKRIFELNGRRWRITPELMREEGVSPHEILPAIHDIVSDAQKKRLLFVGHNALNYDAKILQSHFTDFGGWDFAFGPNELLDTGAIIKALQGENSLEIRPLPHETVRDYCLRLIHSKKVDVKWSLDSEAVHSLGIEEFVDRGEHAHTAAGDAITVYGIIEKFRSRILREPPEECESGKTTVTEVSGRRSLRVSQRLRGGEDAATKEQSAVRESSSPTAPIAGRRVRGQRNS